MGDAARAHMTVQDALSNVRDLRGKITPSAELAPLTWFRVGGPAEALFVPEDADDLANLLQQLPDEIPITVLGVGSNILVRDGGIRGVVVRLGSGFHNISKEDDSLVHVGAGVLDAVTARRAQKWGIGGLEFLSGVPGTIGGALRMNAGAYGSEIKDVFVSAQALDRRGKRYSLSAEDMGFAYRYSKAPPDFIFLSATLRGNPQSVEQIQTKMDEIKHSRETSQPIRTRTGGSTFKNPSDQTGRKAWQLIDEAGCRGLREGDAQVSEKHCNFLINHGHAKASDLENLGERVRQRVERQSRIKLEWEIRRVGEHVRMQRGSA